MSDQLILIIGIVVFLLMLVGLGLTVYEFHMHVFSPEDARNPRDPKPDDVD